ncbi:hypothetical protein EJ110_NYTH15799 [Nymphaea thermarum]|nr:hypothetical protein EJ110_NYTH15799 [Nymphaea thermarum]
MDMNVVAKGIEYPVEKTCKLTLFSQCLACQSAQNPPPLVFTGDHLIKGQTGLLLPFHSFCRRLSIPSEHLLLPGRRLQHLGHSERKAAPSSPRHPFQLRCRLPCQLTPESCSTNCLNETPFRGAASSLVTFATNNRVSLFSEMRREGFEPTHFALDSVLQACSEQRDRRLGRSSI